MPSSMHCDLIFLKRKYFHVEIIFSKLPSDEIGEDFGICQLLRILYCGDFGYFNIDMVLVLVLFF